MAVVLTNVGEQWACDCMSGVTSLTGQYIGWGTGAGTAAKADTVLFTEVQTRVSGTVTTQGTGASAKYQVVGTLTADTTRAITNGGNFDSSSSGVLIVHGDHGTVNLSTGDSIQYTITIDPS